ncbi:MAG: hypothetical protein ACT4OP_13580 [Actinomycetota bacterium]
MASPSTVRVKVDGQGRMVLPRSIRDELVDPPGEVLLRKTPDGLLLLPVEQPGTVVIAEDGLPKLNVGRPVNQEELSASIDRERAER